MNQFFASGGQGYGSISFSISPSSEYSGLISFWMDWLTLLVVLAGTLAVASRFLGLAVAWSSVLETVLKLHPWIM